MAGPENVHCHYTARLSCINKMGRHPNGYRPIVYSPVLPSPITWFSETGSPPSPSLVDPSLQPQFLPDKLSCRPSRGVSGLSVSLFCGFAGITCAHRKTFHRNKISAQHFKTTIDLFAEQHQFNEVVNFGDI